MTTRDTSIETFKTLVRSGKFATQKAALIYCVKTFGSATRRELATRSGLEISAVCGAINKLIEERRLMDWRRVDCKLTRKSVHLVQAFDANDLEPLPEPEPSREPVQGELLPIPAFLR